MKLRDRRVQSDRIYTTLNTHERGIRNKERKETFSQKLGSKDRTPRTDAHWTTVCKEI